LANGYGYVEKFDGWVPCQDTDGVTRDYATFSVILFTDYYEEARKIKGQHQSMELDPISIDGDWADFDGEPYFVYTKGNMLGLCVIGAHEPCFSVSSFFSKNDDTYKTQYEKFSSLLSSLKEKFEEAERNLKGGEQQMNENENKEEVVNPTEEPIEETPAAEEPAAEEFAAEQEEEEISPNEAVVEVKVEFDEKLQKALEELQTSFDELQTKFDNASNDINELNSQIDALRNENNELKTAVANYQAAEAQIEVEKKNTLIENYEKYLNEEEIAPFKVGVNDFSYDELEGKLAIVFANKQMTGNEE